MFLAPPDPDVVNAPEMLTFLPATAFMYPFAAVRLVALISPEPPFATTST